MTGASYATAEPRDGAAPGAGGCGSARGDVGDSAVAHEAEGILAEHADLHVRVADPLGLDLR